MMARILQDLPDILSFSAPEWTNELISFRQKLHVQLCGVLICPMLSGLSLGCVVVDPKKLIGEAPDGVHKSCNRSMLSFENPLQSFEIHCKLRRGSRLSVLVVKCALMCMFLTVFVGTHSL
jgi:hypothetical protein